MILSYESPTPTTSRDGRHCRAEREIGKLSIESVQTNLEWLISIRSIWWRWRDRYHAQITTGFRIDGRVLSKRSGTKEGLSLGSYPRWSESPVMCHHMLPNLGKERTTSDISTRPRGSRRKRPCRHDQSALFSDRLGSIW